MIDDPEREQFSVYTFDPEGFWTREMSFVSAERAMTEAAAWAHYSVSDPRIARVIVTDGGDFTVFEWKRGEGVTFPPPQAKD